MEEYMEVLERCPLFHGIEIEDIRLMLGCLEAKSRNYGKQEYILTAGMSGAETGIVVCGSVHVIKEDFWGNRMILAKAEAGEMFGEAFSCAGAEYIPFSVVAAEETRVLFLNPEKVITTCSSACRFHTGLIQNMVRLLAGKNIMLTEKIEHVTKRSTRAKLLSYLSEQAGKADSNRFKVPFNRQELADFLAVDRSAMSNELSKMREEGILEFHKNEFWLNRTEQGA